MSPKQKPPLLTLIPTTTSLMGSSGFPVQPIVTYHLHSHALETLLWDLAHYHSS